MALLLINGGAGYTTSRTVSVALAVEDLGFTPNEMRISTSSNVADTYNVGYTQFLPTYKLPESVTDGDTVTVYVQLVNGGSNQTLSSDIVYRTEVDRYYRYEETSQFALNALPDHSPIRMNKDSVGHKFFNAIANELGNTESKAQQVETALGLQQLDAWSPDFLARLDLPSDYQSKSTDIDYLNYIKNGAFFVNGPESPIYWNPVGDWSYDTSTHFTGHKGIILEPEDDTQAHIGQVIATNIYGGLVLQGVYKYTSTGSIAANKANRFYIWISRESGVVEYYTEALTTGDTWRNFKTSFDEGSPIKYICVAFAAESASGDLATVQPAFVTLTTDKVQTGSFTPSSLDRPIFVTGDPFSPVDLSSCSAVPTFSDRDFWYESVPTRVSVDSTQYPLPCSDVALFTRTQELTASAAQTTFSLNDYILFPEDTVLIVGGVWFTHGIDYTISGKTLTWSNYTLANSEKLKLIYKSCKYIPDDEDLIGSIEDETLTATSYNQTAFTLSSAIPDGGVIFFNGEVHRKGESWTSSGTSFTWYGPPYMRVGDELLVIHDPTTIPDYTIGFETSYLHNHYSNDRRLYKAICEIYRVDKIIQKRVTTTNDVFATYDTLSWYDNVNNSFYTLDANSFVGSSRMKDHYYAIMREPGGDYSILVLDAGTPQPDNGILEVFWKTQLELGGDVQVIGCEVVDEEQRVLKLYTPNSYLYVRLYFDYAAYDDLHGYVYLREEPPVDNPVVQPLYNHSEYDIDL